MATLQTVERQLADFFKDTPKLSENSKKTLVQYCTSVFFEFSDSLGVSLKKSASCLSTVCRVAITRPLVIYYN